MFDFDSAFKALTGHPPFRWQRRLFDEELSRGKLPDAVDIPTGLGKTAVMAVWLLARAAGAPLPRRLIYVVDRRAVVDQATDYAGAFRRNLEKLPELASVRRGLRLEGRRLPISTLRGRHVDNREWLEDPAGPAIVVGTVDMIGSRLLFEGYGVSRRMRPCAAGLTGCDTLVMLDEAHLSRPFERLLKAIAAEQRGAGMFAGTAASAALPPPLRVLPLSATLGGDSGTAPFGLCDGDREDIEVRKRLDAVKALTIEELEGGARLEDTLAERAWKIAQEASGAGRPARVLIYCDRRETAEKVEERLRKRAKAERIEARPILFVGGRRVHEREEAAQALKDYGLIAGDRTPPPAPVFVAATSAGEVGVDLDADHMVCDLVAWERMVQRLGRVNRRGTGRASVWVIDQGPPDEKKWGKEAAARHKAARSLLESLPWTGDAFQAGPDALVRLGKDPALRERIGEASTPMPLYPALSRPLVDSWAMTSLTEHAGRPEVGPWLRGWVDDDPQTTVIWRHCLPLRCDREGVRAPEARETNAFFEAAPPQAAERLETETYRVVDWLKKRAKRLLKTLGNGPARAAENGDEGADDDAEAAETEGYDLLAPLLRDTPVAFVLGSDGRHENTLSLADIAGRDTKALNMALAGRQLVLDARFGGIENGLLDDRCGDIAATVEDNWGRPEPPGATGEAEADESGLPTLRVRLTRDDGRADEAGSEAALRPWQEVLAAPRLVSDEGEPRVWTVVEKRRGAVLGEDSRSVASKAQKLAEHQAWVAGEAGKIADSLGLCPEDRAMLVAAARHHDDGKAAPRWQRAFNARRDGVYAKTSSRPNQQVLNGYRHEFQSVLDAGRGGLDGVDRDDPRFELALHLIAAHHGQARPIIGIDGCDSLPPTAAANEARKIALRFARLQRRWGPWGLAWWETLLRAADQRASRKLDAEERSDLFSAGAREAG